MVSEITPAAPTYIPKFVESSGTDNMNASSMENLTQADFNNRRLAQALHYLSVDGGEDSPSTFISRVNLIDVALLRQLHQKGTMFDTKLYRRVRAMVLDVQRDFESAAHEATPQSESDENMAEYYTPTADEEALYRASDSSPSPTPAPTRAPQLHTPRRPGSDDVERERVFNYGGPNNNSENWHKDSPAILPFPETLLIAHWESLKIDYDLARSKNSNIVQTDIPFDHPQLQQYFNLPPYESGSRFRHPAVSKNVQTMVSRYGTAIQLEIVVVAFNKGGASNDGSEKYCPRAVLEKFTIGKQAPPNVVSPNQLRRALATTPTKRRVLSTGSTSTLPSRRDSPTFIEDCLYETDNTPEPRVVSRSRPAHLGSSSKSRATPTPTRAGAAIRAFEKKVRQSSGAQVAADAEHVGPAKKPSPIRTMTHVEIPKRGRGRPRKTLLASDMSPSPSTPVGTNLGKRKPSAGSQPYTAPKSSIKKNLRDAKRQKITPAKTAGFVDAPIALEEDSEDPNYPASPVKRPVRAATMGVRKAAVAGKQARKKRAPKKTEEMVTVEEYERRIGKGKGIVKVAEGVKRGTTRSGAKFSV